MSLASLFGLMLGRPHLVRLNAIGDRGMRELRVGQLEHLVEVDESADFEELVDLLRNHLHLDKKVGLQLGRA